MGKEECKGVDRLMPTCQKCGLELTNLHHNQQYFCRNCNLGYTVKRKYEIDLDEEFLRLFDEEERMLSNGDGFY